MLIGFLLVMVGLGAIALTNLPRSHLGRFTRASLSAVVLYASFIGAFVMQAGALDTLLLLATLIFLPIGFVISLLLTLVFDRIMQGR